MTGSSPPPPRRPRPSRGQRGQAMVETAMMTVLLVAWGGILTHFFPDSLNALQIYMDSFYFMFSMPIP